MESNDFHPALGSPLAIPIDLRSLFHRDGFRPKGQPKPGDWLAQHDEGGQTLHDFIKSNPNRPDGRREVLYLQPFGEWCGPQCPPLAALERYASAYFLRDVAILPSISLDDLSVTERYNPHEGQRQLLTTDILRYLARRLPADGFCMLGMSMTDLYPDPNWNFVFGQASLRNRVGVYSFARYTAEEDSWLTLRRSLKVMAHEIGHMYGMTHCTFFECGLNGSNHLEEADRRPMHLCPVCLRKLNWSSDIDPLERYYNLNEFYRNFGFDEAESFVRSRIERCAN
ncbi:MAG: archaemetzincin [Persicimonas sp.]